MECLKEASIVNGSSLDALGRRRFHSFNPSIYLTHRNIYMPVMYDRTGKTYVSNLDPLFTNNP